MPDPAATLFFPFERELLDVPGAGQRVVIFGAGSTLRLPPEFTAEILAVQGSRPDYLTLMRAGYDVVPELEGGDFDAALVLLGRHRHENELQVARALECLKPGGLLLVAGSKKDGAASFAKRMARRLPLENQLSKHNGVVFWVRRPEALDRAVFAPTAARASKTPEGYETAVGGFSQGEIDPGSGLLADSLPGDVSGSVADFGAGWGYLSLQLVKRFSPTAIHLYEAHYPSLEAARRNLARYAPEAPCRFFWCDLLSEPVERAYDVIVMNPPFHRGRAAEPDLGREMIRVAGRALNPGGRLFLVANRTLPYEAVLKSEFSRQGEISSDSAYKVLWASR